MSDKLSIPSLKQIGDTAYTATASSNDANAVVSELLAYAIRVSTAGGRIAASDNETGMASVATSPTHTALSATDKLQRQQLAHAKQLMYLSRYGATIEERERADAGYHDLLEQRLHPDMKALLDLQSLQNRKILALAAKHSKPNATVLAAAEATSEDSIGEMFKVKTQLHQVTEALVDAKRMIRELINVEKALHTPKTPATSRRSHAGLNSHQSG